MKTIQLNAVTIALLVPLMIMMANKTPDRWSEGPFNHDVSKGFFADDGLVPNTLYHNNKTDFVTVWDEDQGRYVTYEQESGAALDRVVFQAEEVKPERDRERPPMVAGYRYRAGGSGGGKVAMVGARVAPTTHLDEEGMKIQAEHGCAGCHTM